MDINIQKGIEQIKKISLTNEEKSKMLHNLSMHADIHQPIPVTHSLFSFFNISLNRKLATVLASVMIAVILGGTAVFASEQSLPGELLYTVKTKVVEPMKVAMATTPKEKAKVETELADRRLNEAEMLDKRGRLTPALNTKINKEFDNHVADFYKIKNKISKDIQKEVKKSKVPTPALTSVDTNIDTEEDTLQNNFENKIKSHTEMLNKFNRDHKGLEKINIKEVKNFQGNIREIKKIEGRGTSSENNKYFEPQSEFED